QFSAIEKDDAPFDKLRDRRSPSIVEVHRPYGSSRNQIPPATSILRDRKGRRKRRPYGSSRNQYRGMSIIPIQSSPAACASHRTATPPRPGRAGPPTAHPK